MRNVVAVLIVMLAVPHPVYSAEEEFPESLERIAFGSCAEQFKSQPIWDAVVEKKPQLFLFLGDNIYADTEDMQLMQEKYNQLGEQPGYKKLLKTCPVLATWDDHDYGVNDGGAWYPKKVESQKIMLDFFGVPDDSIRRTRPGVYGSFAYGPKGRRVQIILLDTRYFKSRHTKDERSDDEKKKLNLVGWYVPNHDPDATILGAAQWEWLEEQLKEPADVRLICSSIQVIADEKGMESWGNFPLERKRLYDLIEQTKADGVVFLSGDVHFTETSKTDDGPYPFYDFTSSSLSVGIPKWAEAVNSFRVSKTSYAEPTFGYVEIKWGKSPAIDLQAYGEAGELIFENRVTVSALR
ncbi:MAG: alkaline phosphatase D family protein [Planctomycetota bacterium]|nr:alkaline phosphatase D family protein [Planctomycetota bacterium]MDA1213623.1 alkaline phosphatase D family protein [Planctomycetota bacterium]